MQVKQQIPSTSRCETKTVLLTYLPQHLPSSHRMMWTAMASSMRMMVAPIQPAHPPSDNLVVPMLMEMDTATQRMPFQIMRMKHLILTATGLGTTATPSQMTRMRPLIQTLMESVITATPSQMTPMRPLIRTLMESVITATCTLLMRMNGKIWTVTRFQITHKQAKSK